MHLIGNNKTQKLDSLKVLNNAFIIQKDSLSKNGYNQIKGQNLYGKFIDSKLKEVEIVDEEPHRREEKSGTTQNISIVNNGSGVAAWNIGSITVNMGDKK